MKKAIIVLACAAAILTGCKSTKDSADIVAKEAPKKPVQLTFDFGF